MSADVLAAISQTVSAWEAAYQALVQRVQVAVSGEAADVNHLKDRLGALTVAIHRLGNFLPIAENASWLKIGGVPVNSVDEIEWHLRHVVSEAKAAGLSLSLDGILHPEHRDRVRDLLRSWQDSAVAACAAQSPIRQPPATVIPLRSIWKDEELPSPYESQTLEDSGLNWAETDQKSQAPKATMTMKQLMSDLREYGRCHALNQQKWEAEDPAFSLHSRVQQQAFASDLRASLDDVLGFRRLRSFVLRKWSQDISLATCRKVLGEIISKVGCETEDAEDMQIADAAQWLNPDTAIPRGLTCPGCHQCVPEDRLLQSEVICPNCSKFKYVSGCTSVGTTGKFTPPMLVRLHAPLGWQIMPASGTPSKSSPAKQKPRNKPSEPTKQAIAAHLLELAGLKQGEIAKKLTEEFGKPFDQGSVSRLIGKVKAWIKAGNVLPSLPSQTSRSTRSYDPSVLDLGQRQDGRTHRQRDKRDSSDAADD